MARMTCRCGAYLNNQQVPNDVQLWVYTDRQWEEIFDCDSIEPWTIPLPAHDVWRCPKCRRIYVFERGDSAAATVYAPEKLPLRMRFRQWFGRMKKKIAGH